MTQEEAEKELYSYLTTENGAMLPIGYVDNLISKIYRDFKEEYIKDFNLYKDMCDELMLELKNERKIKDSLLKRLH